MSKQINKKGFTLAEALIAMLLVAVMAAGIITALMATKRAIVAPSNREEMIMAIERASSLIQTGNLPSTCGITDPLAATPTATCDFGSNPVQLTGCHNINCLRPRSCQGTSDYFYYSVIDYTGGNNEQEQKIITFRIQCEGQTI
ncbi:MAG: type II secretion system protein [Elusimicrobiaceae bacterium]|nr:type II secretion system protein [Elusimicrobiaceae bacterium]